VSTNLTGEQHPEALRDATKRNKMNLSAECSGEYPSKEGEESRGAGASSAEEETEPSGTGARESRWGDTLSWSKDPLIEAKMNQLAEAKEKFFRLQQLIAIVESSSSPAAALTAVRPPRVSSRDDVGDSDNQDVVDVVDVVDDDEGNDENVESIESFERYIRAHLGGEGASGIRNITSENYNSGGIESAGINRRGEAPHDRNKIGGDCDLRGGASAANAMREENNSILRGGVSAQINTGGANSSERNKIKVGENSKRNNKQSNEPPPRGGNEPPRGGNEPPRGGNEPPRGSRYVESTMSMSAALESMATARNIQQYRTTSRESPHLGGEATVCTGGEGTVLLYRNETRSLFKPKVEHTQTSPACRGGRPGGSTEDVTRNRYWEEGGETERTTSPWQREEKHMNMQREVKPMNIDRVLKTCHSINTSSPYPRGPTPSRNSLYSQGGNSPHHHRDRGEQGRQQSPSLGGGARVKTSATAGGAESISEIPNNLRDLNPAAAKHRGSGRLLSDRPEFNNSRYTHAEGASARHTMNSETVIKRPIGEEYKRPIREEYMRKQKNVSSADVLSHEIRCMSAELRKLDVVVSRSIPAAEDECSSAGEEKDSDGAAVDVAQQTTQLLAQLTDRFQKLLVDNQTISDKCDRLELIALHQATVARATTLIPASQATVARATANPASQATVENSSIPQVVNQITINPGNGIIGHQKVPLTESGSSHVPSTSAEFGSSHLPPTWPESGSSHAPPTYPVEQFMASFESNIANKMRSSGGTSSSPQRVIGCPDTSRLMATTAPSPYSTSTYTAPLPSPLFTDHPHSRTNQNIGRRETYPSKIADPSRGPDLSTRGTDAADWPSSFRNIDQSRGDLGMSGLKTGHQVPILGAERQQVRKYRGDGGAWDSGKLWFDIPAAARTVPALNLDTESNTAKGGRTFSDICHGNTEGGDIYMDRSTLGVGNNADKKVNKRRDDSSDLPPCHRRPPGGLSGGICGTAFLSTSSVASSCTTSPSPPPLHPPHLPLLSTLTGQGCRGVEEERRRESASFIADRLAHQQLIYVL